MKDSQTKQVEQAAKNEPTHEIEKLLAFLAQYGGEIVSTAKLSPEFIEQARASGRLYVDENSLGYVWEPDIDGFPTTEQKVEEFEKWYPLPVELPEKFKNGDWLFDKLHEKKSQPTPVKGDDKIELPPYLVVKGYEDKYEVWPKSAYEKYTRMAVKYGAGSAYKIVIGFNGDEDFLIPKAAPKGDDVISKEEMYEGKFKIIEKCLPPYGKKELKWEDEIPVHVAFKAMDVFASQFSAPQVKWVQASKLKEIKFGRRYFAKWDDGIIKSTGMFQESDGTFFWNEDGYLPIKADERDKLLILIEEYR